MKKILALLSALTLGGCLGMPKNVKPVNGFELNRYLGKWYEIARLDHSFERGLTNVTADYSRQEDGRIRVVKRGFRPADGRWEAAEQEALRFRQDQQR